jgi:hypothetical protein
VREVIMIASTTDTSVLGKESSDRVNENGHCRELSIEDREMVLKCKHDHLKMMKELKEEFTHIAARRVKNHKKKQIAGKIIHKTDQKKALTPYELHRLQRDRYEESMKVKSMRGLLARLEVTLHHKEKQHVIDMIGKLSATMNDFGDKATQTSKEIKDLIHAHIVQKEHLQHEILDLKGKHLTYLSNI